jgi:hypothetical protein
MSVSEFTPIDMKIIMKNDEIACVTLSRSIGTEDGEPVQHLYGLKTLDDVQGKLCNLRCDLPDFPLEPVEFQLDGEAFLRTADKRVVSTHCPSDAVYDKYSNEERTPINITFDKENNMAHFDKPIGRDWNEKDVTSLSFRSGLSQLESDLYNDLQTNEGFPQNADFYIDEQLFVSVNRMAKYHLGANKEMSLDIALDHGKDNTLALKTVENDDGTISLHNVAPEILYRGMGESYNDAKIHDNKGNCKFSNPKEAEAAVNSFLTEWKGQEGRCLKTLDPTSVEIDGKRQGTYINNVRVSKGEETPVKKQSLK